MFSASQKINAYIAAKVPILISNSKDNKISLRHINVEFAQLCNQTLLQKILT